MFNIDEWVRIADESELNDVELKIANDIKTNYSQWHLHYVKCLQIIDMNAYDNGKLIIDVFAGIIKFIDTNITLKYTMSHPVRNYFRKILESALAKTSSERIERDKLQQQIDNEMFLAKFSKVQGGS